MYVAVVLRGTNKLGLTRGSLTSERPNGDWACFVDSTKSGAITKAMSANEKWGNKYTILVGSLTEVARPRRDYYLSEL